MKKLSNIFLVGLLVFAVGVIVYINRTTTQIASPANGKYSIATSFYPMWFFTQEIAGKKAEVFNITPAGTEPHDFEPTTQDLVRINSSAVLVLNGGGLETWGQKVQDQLEKTVVVVTGENLTKEKVSEDGKEIVDPHVWLSPTLANVQMNKILAALVAIDPPNAKYYQANARNLATKFDQLDKEYRQGLAVCQSKNIVTSHAAFGYLAKDYGLKQIAIAGLSPDSEPSPKQLAEVAKFAKDNGVKYIFFESLVSPKLSETIANEIGAKTLVLSPLEGLTDSEIKNGKDYFTVMEDNLKNLRLALSCT